MIIDFILNTISSIYFHILIILIILFYHIVQFLARDRGKIKIVENMKDPSNISIENLNFIPVINVIVPAWNEGEIFRGCLQSLQELKYPKLKIVVNAGGNEETIKIANFYKKYSNFTVIYQKKGKGKLRAINDCLNYVTDGIIYLIDADTYLDDNSIVKIIYPIVNKGEMVVASEVKPHYSIKNKDLVKYLYINRNNRFRKKLSRYSLKIVGPNTCINYKVISKIKKFTEKRHHDDGRSIYLDISSLGYRVYHILSYETNSFNYPYKIRDYIYQNIRWIENNLYYSIYTKNWTRFIKLLFLVFYSIYIIVFPFLIFLNYNLFLFGLYIIFSMYLKKIRKIILYKLTTKKKDQMRLGFLFYIKLILFSYIETFMNIYVSIEFLFFRKKYKKRKNLA